MRLPYPPSIRIPRVPRIPWVVWHSGPNRMIDRLNTGIWHLNRWLNIPRDLIWEHNYRHMSRRIDKLSREGYLRRRTWTKHDALDCRAMRFKLNSWDKLRFWLIKQLAGSSLILINARAPKGEESVVFAPPAAKVYVRSCHSARLILTDDRLRDWSE